MENPENMSNEEVEDLKTKTEIDFFKKLDNSESIRNFLYFPKEFLTKKVMRHLDEFLITEGWKLIEKFEDSTLFLESFIVYKDEMIEIKLEERKDQDKFLKNSLTFFIEHEEYEKCSIITNLQQTLVSQESPDNTGNTIIH